MKFSKDVYTPVEVAYMTGVKKLGQWKITREALEAALEKRPEGSGE